MPKSQMVKETKRERINEHRPGKRDGGFLLFLVLYLLNLSFRFKGTVRKKDEETVGGTRVLAL